MAEHLQKAKVPPGAKVGALAALKTFGILSSGPAYQTAANCKCAGARKNFATCELGVAATDIWVGGKAAGLEPECSAKVAISLTMRQWLALCLHH